jgi:hypothetical protein
VDLKGEHIYVSRPIFWQATALINGDTKTKSVQFVRTVDKKDEKAIRDVVPAVLAQAFALSPSLPDVIYSHKIAMRYLKQFLSLYVDVFHYDAHCEIHDVDALKTLLESCRILLWDVNLDSINLENHEKRFLYSFDYWVKNSGDWATDEVTNYSAQVPVKALVPLLIAELKRLRCLVFQGKYYWAHKDRTYLRLVYETELPFDSEHETLRDWGYQFEKHQNQVIGFSLFEGLKAADLEKAGIA